MREISEECRWVRAEDALSTLALLSICCMLSVPLGEQPPGRRWDCSGLGHVARRYFGTKWYNDPRYGVPEMVTPAMRTTAVGTYIKLCDVQFLPWQNHHNAASGAKICRYGTLWKVRFLFKPWVPEFFCAILAKICCPLLGTLGTNGLNRSHGTGKTVYYSVQNNIPCKIIVKI